MKKVRIFSLSEYVEQALKRAEYSHDDPAWVVARVPEASGFFAQGETVEEARANLRDVIEGNVLLALQLGVAFPQLRGLTVKEVPLARINKKHGKTDSSQSKRRGA